MSQSYKPSESHDAQASNKWTQSIEKDEKDNNIYQIILTNKFVGIKPTKRYFLFGFKWKFEAEMIFSCNELASDAGATSKTLGGAASVCSHVEVQDRRSCCCHLLLLGITSEAVSRCPSKARLFADNETRSECRNVWTDWWVWRPKSFRPSK